MSTTHLDLRSCHHEHKPMISNHGHHHHDETDHHHHHHHHHSHAIDVHRPRQRRAFFLCIGLTLAMMIVEFVAGWITSSLMLISDGIHMLTHASALFVSLIAIVIANRKASDRFSFGLYRVEILAALINAIGLAIFTFWIVYEGVLRLLDPPKILSAELLFVALAGLFVNLATAWILHNAGVEDLNTKSAFLHMIADTLSSVAIVIGGVIIYFTEWYILDPILSIFVAVLIGRWSWTLLRDSTMILLERQPSHVDLTEIKTEIEEKIESVKDLHDLHIWEITSQFVCFTAHATIDEMTIAESSEIRKQITHLLQDHHGIAHSVIEFECA